MDKQYIELFKTLAQATASTAEQVMEYDRSKDDNQGLETATLMRDDYQDLVGVVDFDNFMPIGLTEALFPSNCGNAFQQLETVLFSKGRDSILGTVFLKS